MILVVVVKIVHVAEVLSKRDGVALEFLERITKIEVPLIVVGAAHGRPERWRLQQARRRVGDGGGEGEILLRVVGHEPSAAAVEVEVEVELELELELVVVGVEGMCIASLEICFLLFFSRFK